MVFPNVVGGVYDDGGSGGTIPGGGGISGGTPNGGTLTDAFQLSYLNGGSWTILLTKSCHLWMVSKSKRQKAVLITLQYRTWNQGQGDFYPYVTSTEMIMRVLRANQSNYYKFKHLIIMERS
ncbi:MAG: hypothetical protein V8Q17_08120 [Acutalibacteraceae bacterium]